MAEDKYEDEAAEVTQIESVARLAAFLETEQEWITDLLLAREFGLLPTNEKGLAAGRCRAREAISRSGLC